MHSLLQKTIMIGAVLLTAACATSRSEIQLGATPESATKNIVLPANAPLVYIRSVKDERVFEQAPNEPSTPSLGFEGSSQASNAIKLRAIARKRNGFGKALGDVLLPEGQTVETVVAKNLTQAFNQIGYRVSNGSASEKPAITIDVQIKKFWSWMNPGFATISLETQIETDIQVEAGAMIKAKSSFADRWALVNDLVWTKTNDQALKLYREDVMQKFSKK